MKRCFSFFASSLCKWNDSRPTDSDEGEVGDGGNSTSERKRSRRKREPRSKGQHFTVMEDVATVTAGEVVKEGQLHLSLSPIPIVKVGNP